MVLAAFENDDEIIIHKTITSRVYPPKVLLRMVRKLIRFPFSRG